MSNWTVIKQSVDGTGSSMQTYSMPGRKLYVMIPNINTVNKATEKIKEVQNSN